MAATSRDEFVDLYDVMDLPVDSDAETIRQRLNTLYLEAQQNLDHRNVKKRLQYQQMYEIYLPQGRHLLLHPARRAEYDRYLTAYRTGNKVAPSSTSSDAGENGMGELSKTEEPPIPGMAAVEVDPEVLAAEREDMWAKWKTGLETVGDSSSEIFDSLPGDGTSLSAPVANVSSASTRPAPPTPRGYTAPTPRPRVAGGATVGRTAPPAPRAAGAGARPRAGTAPAANLNAPHFETPNAPDAAGDIEKQRERQRYQLIKDSVQNAGLMWGGIYAGGIFFAGLIILFIVDSSIKKYPLNMSRSVFALICFLLILAAAAIGGLIARRNAKQRAVAQFSVLSTEELMRHNRA